jgi:RAT1-interacting protein
MMTKSHQFESFIKHKCLKTWAQSYLAGVRTVIFGFRDDDGRILETKTYETQEFPRLARKNNYWDPNVCLTFGAQVLKFIRETVKIDDINTVYTIRYSSKSEQIEILEPNHGGDSVFVRK